MQNTHCNKNTIYNILFHNKTSVIIYRRGVGLNNTRMCVETNIQIQCLHFVFADNASVWLYGAMIEQTPRNKCTSMYDTDSARNRLTVYSLLFKDSEPPDNKRVETCYINLG